MYSKKKIERNKKAYKMLKEAIRILSKENSSVVFYELLHAPHVLKEQIETMESYNKYEQSLNDRV